MLNQGGTLRRMLGESETTGLAVEDANDELKTGSVGLGFGHPRIFEVFFPSI